MGKDMDNPPAASLATADHLAPLSDMPQALFDMPWEAIVHLGPTIRYEQDPTLSKFTSYSQDILLGALLYTMLLPGLR